MLQFVQGHRFLDMVPVLNARLSEHEGTAKYEHGQEDETLAPAKDSCN